MKMKKFIREYMYEDWYLANLVPQEMMSELALPRCLKCGFHPYLQEAEMWLSSGGTSSLLHSHADHNMHCLHSGRKDFILIEREHVGKMEYVDRDPYKGAGYSTMEMEMVNMYKYGHIAQTPWIWSTLKPGDCIFIPSGYPHQVRSYGRSLSTTMHWAPAPELDFKDCIHKDLDKMTPLSDAPFLWTYSVAERQLTNMRLSAASLRHHIVVWMAMDDAFTYQLFEAVYGDIMSEMSNAPDVKTVWEMLAPKKAKKITREQVAKLEEAKLTAVADILNTPHKRVHDEL